MRIFTNIPVSLCEYALVNQKINPLKLYIYLKLNSDGYILDNKELYSIWAKTIGISVKTIKSSLAWLIKNKWIIVNGKRNALNVISYQKLLRKLKIKPQSGCFCRFKDCIDFKKIKSLCSAIVITYYLNKRKYCLNRSERIKEGSITNREQKGFYLLSNHYLAKCLRVSISTAYRHKQKAKEAGYIEIKGNCQFIETKDGGYISKDSYSVFVNECMKEGLPNIYRKGRTYLKAIGSDLVRSNINLKTKR